MQIQPKRSKEEVNQERFKVMAVRLARHLHLSTAEDFDSLPISVKNTFRRFKYHELVMPLVEYDRETLGLTFRQLEIKYGLPKSTIQYHCKK